MASIMLPREARTSNFGSAISASASISSCSCSSGIVSPAMLSGVMIGLLGCLTKRTRKLQLHHATQCEARRTVLKNTYEGQACSIARSLELIGERWTLLIVRDVFRGLRRFDEIQESLGIARNVLANRLDRLVEEGILEKRRYQEHPPRCEYFLTEKGIDLWPVLVSLIKWGDKHEPLGVRRSAAA